MAPESLSAGDWDAGSGCPWRYIRGGLPPADWPPSMGITAPLTYEEAGVDSQITVWATSGGLPILRIGEARAASRWASGPAASRWWVRMVPGATTLTRMPWSA